MKNPKLITMQKNLEYLNRFAQMLTKTQLAYLLKAKIIIFGVGGVGGALAHFLVRSGVQNLDVVDFDKIDITNLNRQLISFQNNVGKLKVEELKTQLKNINPNLNINTFAIKYSVETQNEIDLKQYDIILDCVDDVAAKKLLVLNAKANNVYILSAMGAGNRYKDIPQFEIADISKTSYDALAKIMRKFCAQNGIKHLDVCYTKQTTATSLTKNLAQKTCKNISSVVYYPITMAAAMCAHVINKIVKE